MGRTQPSLTRAIDSELEKLIRISRKLRNERLAEKVREITKVIREVEEAMEDEITDPLEVILIALLITCGGDND